MHFNVQLPLSFAKKIMVTAPSLLLVIHTVKIMKNDLFMINIARELTAAILKYLVY
jgi:hypothetical protein